MYIQYKNKILHTYFTYFVTGNLYLESGQFKCELVVIMTKISQNRVHCLHSEKGLPQKAVCEHSSVVYEYKISVKTQPFIIFII